MEKKFNITINSAWCKACGICIFLCPKNVFDADDEGKAVVKSLEKCIGCLSCEVHCPDYAIEVVEVQND